MNSRAIKTKELKGINMNKAMNKAISLMLLTLGITVLGQSIEAKKPTKIEAKANSLKPVTACEKAALSKRINTSAEEILQVHTAIIQGQEDDTRKAIDETELSLNQLITPDARVAEVDRIMEDVQAVIQSQKKEIQAVNAEIAALEQIKKQKAADALAKANAIRETQLQTVTAQQNYLNKQKDILAGFKDGIKTVDDNNKG